MKVMLKNKTGASSYCSMLICVLLAFAVGCGESESGNNSSGTDSNHRNPSQNNDVEANNEVEENNSTTDNAGPGPATNNNSADDAPKWQLKVFDEGIKELGGLVENLTMGLDANDQPVVAYMTNPRLGDSTSKSEVHVVSWNGSEWVGLGMPYSDIQAVGSLSMVMDGSGFPIIAFTKIVAFPNNLLPPIVNVLRWNGSSWDELRNDDVKQFNDDPISDTEKVIVSTNSAGDVYLATHFVSSGWPHNFIALELLQADGSWALEHYVSNTLITNIFLNAEDPNDVIFGHSLSQNKLQVQRKTSDGITDLPEMTIEGMGADRIFESFKFTTSPAGVRYMALAFSDTGRFSGISRSYYVRPMMVTAEGLALLDNAKEDGHAQGRNPSMMVPSDNRPLIVNTTREQLNLRLARYNPAQSSCHREEQRADNTGCHGGYPITEGSQLLDTYETGHRMDETSLAVGANGTISLAWLQTVGEGNDREFSLHMGEIFPVN